MELKIDPKEVEAVIRVKVQEAIATVLTKDSKAMIETIVVEALTQKKDSWTKETLFGDSVRNMIRQAAQEAFKEWLEQQKPIIHAAIVKRLKAERDGFADSIALKVVQGLASSFYVSATLKVED